MPVRPLVFLSALVLAMVGLMAPAASAQRPYVGQEVFAAGSFGFAVDLQHDNADPDRLYLVEQAGRILAFSKTGDGSDAAPFLDIQSRVLSGGESGLLGLAFHPDYASNGRFFVYYTASQPMRSIVAEFARSTAEPSMADASSERILLTVPQPFSNHNAGQIAFGPDGFLYIALGDGGSGGDPEENGEDPTTLLGSILRIDVDAQPAGAPYGIPPDNPFAGRTDGQAEVFAYGLRNPWRFSFDFETGDLWAADVGQNAFEEVNLIVNGGNYGWDVTEAFSCFEPRTNCDRTDLIDPVFAYAHVNGGRSVTGGYVYRGPTLVDLTGRYVYGDFLTGEIWSLDASDTRNPVNTLIASIPNPASFGTDADGELYVLSAAGPIYRLVRSVDTEDDGVADRALLLEVVGANPFRGGVTLRAEAAMANPATLRVYDALGRLVATLLDAQVQPGQSVEARFEAGGLPAGLYLARLQVGVQSVTRRLVVVR